MGLPFNLNDHPQLSNLSYVHEHVIFALGSKLISALLSELDLTTVCELPVSARAFAT